MGTKATLDGTDVTASLRDRGVSWGPRDLTTHIDVGSVLLRGTSPVAPDDDMVLEITDTDGLTKVFGGVVRMPDAEETIGDGGAELTYQVRAQGWAALLYRIPITTTKAYAAGVSDAYIVRDLLASYYGSIATSVTHVVRSSRVDMPAMTFVAGQLSLGQALDQIAVEANGAPWSVDPDDKAVHWNDTRRRAPFIISTTPDAVARESYRREVLADAPVAYWRLGETSGATAADESGNGNDGTYAGAVLLDRAGLVDDDDGSIELTAASGYMDAGTGFNFAGNVPFTVEVWLTPTAIPHLTWARICSCELTDGSGRQGWTMSLDDTQTPDGGFEMWRDGAGVGVALTGGPGLKVGVVSHLVATYDGANIRFYQDGVLRGGPTAGKNLKATGAALRFGQYTGGGSQYVGRQDEAALYDYALSPTRIAAHYAARVKRKVGTRHITRLADSTQQAHRVKVVGNSSNATYEATDWREWNRLQKRLAKESGAPSARILALPDVVDENITTLEQAQRRAWSILANQARRRPYVATVMEPGLAPGMRVDAISSKFGTGSDSQPTLRTPLRVRENPGLATGMGRFIIQRVEPELRPGAKDEWQYKVTFGDFQPTLPIALAKATGQGTIARTAIAPKTLTRQELKNRYRNILLPIFGATVRTGTPAIGIYGVNTRFRAWAFDPASLEEIVIEVPRPRDAVTEDQGGDARFSGVPTGALAQVILWYVVLGATSGLARFQVRAQRIDNVQSLDSIASETTIAEQVNVTGAQYTLMRQPLMSDGIELGVGTGIPHAALRLLIGRDGAHGFDTLADDFGLYAVELEYLADS